MQTDKHQDLKDEMKENLDARLFKNEETKNLDYKNPNLRTPVQGENDYRPKSENAEENINALISNENEMVKEVPNQTFYTNTQSKRQKQFSSANQRILDSVKLNNFHKQNLLADASNAYNHIRKNCYEKEILYDESLKLKLNVNTLKEENIRLKTQLLNANEEMKKNEREIEKIYKEINSSNNSNVKLVFHTNSHLILGLKRQIKDMKLEIKEKEDRITILSKNLKVSKVQELESQLLAMNEECIRLKQIIDDLKKNQSMNFGQQISSLESKTKQQSQYIVKLESELEDTISNSKHREFEFQQLTFIKNDLEKKLIKFNKLNQENTTLKKENLEIRREMKKQKDMYIQRQENQNKNKIEEMSKKWQECNDKLKTKTNQLKDSENKIRLLNEEINSLRENFNHEISKINENKKKALNIEKEKVKKLEEKIKEFEASKLIKQGMPEKEAKSTTIKIEDIQTELRQMKLNLQVSKISLDKLSEAVQKSKENLNHLNLEEILESFPFKISINSDRLASFFLGTQTESIEFNAFIQKVQEVLGSYNLYEQSEENYKNELAEVLLFRFFPPKYKALKKQ